MREIPLKQVIEASLENIKKVLDADTVVGSPITLPGDITIIPISKISCGFTSGGVDFDSKKGPHREIPHFGGANAAGVSVTPLTFLVISGNDVRVMNVNGTTASSESAIVSTISDLVEKSPAILAKLKALFKKDKPEETEEGSTTDSEQIKDE